MFATAAQIAEIARMKLVIITGNYVQTLLKKYNPDCPDGCNVLKTQILS